MIFKPNYIKSLEYGTLVNKVEKAKKHLTNCYLCPHECGVDRTEKVGFKEYREAYTFAQKLGLRLD